MTAYLGTAVVAPEQEGELGRIPVMNDLGGRTFPFQTVYDGERCTVLTTLNRFDYTVYRQLRALSHNAASVGTQQSLERGTLEIGYADFQLLMVNAYGGFSSVPESQTDKPRARRYFSAVLSAWKESTAGSRVVELALAFECNSVYNPTTRQFGLYDELEPGVIVPPN